MSSVENIYNFLSGKEISFLIEQYYNHKKIANEDPGINIFELISDKYHRENLHSDIIKFFLDPNEKHKERKYLDKFLNFLKSKDKKIIESDFSEATREKDRIDILIKGEKKAIILENKINNAPDTYRQLPEYFKKLKNKQFDVVAIVYLSLDGNKRPTFEGWTLGEIAEIKKRILYISAYNPENREKDLYHGWIDKCISDTNDEDLKIIFKQYGKLLKLLRGNLMDNQALKGFYDFFAKGNNFQNALEIRDVLDKLGNYLAFRIVEKYNNNYEPFISCNTQALYQAIFSKWPFKESIYSIQIIFSIDEQHYQFCFFDHEGKHITSPKLDNLLSASQLIKKDDGYYRRFQRSEAESLLKLEERLFSFIDVFLIELRKVPK